MDWLSEFVPATPWFVLNLFLLALLLLLALTRLRGTWFAALAGSSMAIMFFVMSFVDQTAALSWRLQVIIQRFVELPVVCGVAVMCIVQVRRLTPSESRFQIVLRVAPVLLVSAWIVSFALQQVWPHPILDYFAKMPIKNWFLLTLLCTPLQFYLGLLAFLFFRAAGVHSPTRRLRMQNFLLAVSIGGYGLSYLNILLSYAVLAWLDNPARTQVTLIQFAIEERLFFLWGPALLGGVLLAAFPAAVKEVRVSDALALLPVRERFEGLLWRLEVVGSLRRLARPLFHLQTAALELGLSEDDTAKASQTVKLVAIMGSPKAPPALSCERVRDLLSRLEACGAWWTEPPTSWSLGHTDLCRTSDPAHLSEILHASLHLTSPISGIPLNLRSSWFDLAHAVCADAGIANEEYPADLAYEQVLEAYRRATNLATDV